MTTDETIYGPFLDEEMFFYHDRTDLELELLEIYDEDVGFIGFDDLQKVYDLGRQGNFENIVFSGRVTLRKTDILCEAGFRTLLKEVQKKDPTMDPNKLRKACAQEKIIFELHCQLAVMPVCYLTSRPPHSILIYSRNKNNINGQRRYIVRTFRISCFRRSELTLQRYFILKFIMDACKEHEQDVLREDRDVHWLVTVYLESYSNAFKRHERPTLHRSEVYDHFATHAEWLRNVFRKKRKLVDLEKWEDWVEEAKLCQKKAKGRNVVWGVAMTRPILLESRNQRRRSFSLDSYPENEINMRDDTEIDYVPSSDSESDSSSSEELSSDDDDDSHADVKYIHDPRLRSRAYPGLFSKRMPDPQWYWLCDIQPGCRFIIDIGNQRRQDAPCMSPLNDKEKNYLMHSVWGLYDSKLRKIWKKMCQAHMDWHWKEAGLILDHENRRIYGVEDIVVRQGNNESCCNSEIST